MTRSARGTRETPGRNVRQKSGLNRSILSQGWGNVPVPAGIQAGTEWRPPGPGRSPEHLPDLFRLRTRVGGEPAGPGHLPVRLLRLLRPRRRQCGQEHTQGGARPQRLFGGSVLRAGGLTVQAVRSIPVSKRGVGRKGRMSTVSPPLASPLRVLGDEKRPRPRNSCAGFMSL